MLTKQNILYGMTKKPNQGLFGKSKPESEDISRFFNATGDLGRRLRVIEERFVNLRRKTQLTEQNMLSSNKRFSTEIKTLNAEINDIKSSLNDITYKLSMVLGELKKMASKNDLKVLDKYLDYWEPLNFLRRDEAEALVKEALEKIKKE